MAKCVSVKTEMLHHRLPLSASMDYRPIEVSQSRDILTSHTFVSPYWRSSHSLPGMLWYGVDIVKVFI